MYTKSFYELQKKQNIKSAEKIVPIIKKLLFENAEHDKLTVCDVGCGSGNWLYVFKKYGFKVTGIDRNPYMDRGMLEKDEFVQYDFESGKNKKPPLEDRFGLVICLEVLEHLPEKYADNMIDLLVNCSDYVLFSAAVPLQGGTGHVNEQWQSYWVKKFEKKGYILCDCIRPLIWDDDEITFFYRQNIMLFAKDCKTDFKLINQNGGGIVDMIHPAAWKKVCLRLPNRVILGAYNTTWIYNIYAFLKNIKMNLINRIRG